MKKIRMFLDRGAGRILLAVGAACCIVALDTCGANALDRRIGISARANYFIFDESFFDLDGGFGGCAAFRYELGWDTYFENALGLVSCQGSDVSVQAFDYHLNILSIFPVLVPYRPLARLGIGFISVNPLTVTPTDTFRPTQTAFYFMGGAGVTRSIGTNLVLEASSDVWITPYKYRIYRFNRTDVETSDERFLHLGFSLGILYTF